MISPRWAKMVREIWIYKARTLGIILSIAIGVFAVGTMVHMNLIVSRDLDESYALVSPANFTVYTADGFEPALLRALRELPGVAEADGQRRLIARFRHVSPVAGEEWYPIELVAVPDYNDIRVNKIFPETDVGSDWAGDSWPPRNDQMVIERTGLLTSQQGLLRSERGHTILVESPAGRRQEMMLAGLSYDFNQAPSPFAGRGYGYITLRTMAELGQPLTYNVLHVRVTEPGRGSAHIEAIAAQVRDEVKKRGIEVDRVELYEPGKLPLDYVFRAISLIMVALGVMSLFLSSFLIINTISALLRQQVRQIGIMKAIGARTPQLVWLYLGTVLFYGIIAVLIAMPLSFVSAQWFTGFLSYFLNFKLSGFHIPPEVILFDLLIGLLVPLLAAIVPILNGTKITVREAISDAGTSEATLSDQLINPLARLIPSMPRPLSLSLRNTFRHPARLGLTLATLIVASATFIAVLTLRESMNRTIDHAFNLWQYDVLLQFRQPYSIPTLDNIARQNPEVEYMEGWLESTAYRIYDEERSGASFQLIAPPAATRLLNPTLLDGRWLLPDDEGAIVVDTQLLKAEPDLRLGSTLTLNTQNKERTWRVVGIVQSLGPIPFAYTNYEHYSRLVGDRNRANRMQFLTRAGSPFSLEEVGAQLEAQFTDRGVEVIATHSTTELRAQSQTLFNIITSLLLTMAILIALVGGLGLMGTMSLNILERTREIGVMRAIGASDSTVLSIVFSEGLLIGLTSWALGALLAYPLSQPLCALIGTQFFQAPLVYQYSITGVLIWLGLVVLLVLFSIALPAQHALEIRVSAALAYE